MSRAQEATNAPESRWATESAWRVVHDPAALRRLAKLLFGPKPEDQGEDGGADG